MYFLLLCRMLCPSLGMPTVCNERSKSFWIASGQRKRRRKSVKCQIVVRVIYQIWNNSIDCWHRTGFFGRPWTFTLRRNAHTINDHSVSIQLFINSVSSRFLLTIKCAQHFSNTFMFMFKTETHKNIRLPIRNSHLFLTCARRATDIVQISTDYRLFIVCSLWNESRSCVSLSRLRTRNARNVSVLVDYVWMEWIFRENWRCRDGAKHCSHTSSHNE